MFVAASVPSLAAR